MSGGGDAVILRVLAASNCALYGLGIVAASDGAVGRGTIYVRLARLEDAGLVRSHLESTPALGGMARRLYAITNEGRATLIRS